MKPCMLHNFAVRFTDIMKQMYCDYCEEEFLWIMKFVVVHNFIKISHITQFSVRTITEIRNLINVLFKNITP